MEGTGSAINLLISIGVICGIAGLAIGVLTALVGTILFRILYALRAGDLKWHAAEAKPGASDEVAVPQLAEFNAVVKDLAAGLNTFTAAVNAAKGKGE